SVARGRTYARRAARQAGDRLAYEQAARLLTRALETWSRSGEDEDDRAEVLIELGESRLRAGDWPAAAEALQQAAASARRRLRGDQLARAALGLGAGLGGFEVRLFDRRQLDLLDEVLAVLGTAEPVLRVRVLARLSVALSFVESTDRRLALAEEAVWLAREVDDPGALAAALAARCDALAGPSHVGQRLADATEIVELARGIRDPEMQLVGRRIRFVALLESGDLPGADAELEAFAHVAEQLRQPLYAWCAPLWRALRALMQGRLADYERWAQDAREQGNAAASRNAGLLVDVQRIWWLVEIGRAAEARALCERFVTEGFPSARPWVAYLDAEAGHLAEARAQLDQLVGHDFAELPEHGEWLATLCVVAAAAVLVAHEPAAAAVYPRLLPYARQYAVDGPAIFLGSVSHYLGRLAAVLGRGADADEHFDHTLADHRSAGSALLVAHTLRERATARIAVGGAAGRAAATPLLREAADTYRELGLAHRARDCAALGEPRAAADGARRGLFRREGDHWSVGYGDEVATIRDARGLRDIAALLARPGTEVRVLDLVGPAAPRRAAPEGLAEQSDAGPVLDETARAAYRRRLAELDDDLAEAQANADTARSARAQAERDALVAQLAGAYGLGGRSRRMGDPVERARSAVTWRIRAALRRIEEVHPALGRHLSHAVRTGAFCSYTPEQPVEWTL
ncbi:MAG TPA: hypothetical protein VNB64_06165, partial [Solirubrobacteraceae bacterium]|nr:hypothetical protein [Solirubrobacteraceae bacterium]